MTIETPEDLAETVADWLGVYGHCDNVKCKDNLTCCRTAFAPDFADRIRRAVHNENELEKLNLKDEKV